MSWRLEETCYHSNSSERPLVNVDGKNSQGVNNNNNNNNDDDDDDDDDKNYANDIGIISKLSNLCLMTLSLLPDDRMLFIKTN